MRITTLQQSDYCAQQGSGRRGVRDTAGETTYLRSVDGCSAILSVGARLHLEARRAYQDASSERADRVEALRQQVQAGSYRVDAAGLCDSILAIPRDGGNNG